MNLFENHINQITADLFFHIVMYNQAKEIIKKKKKSRTGSRFNPLVVDWIEPDLNASHL